MIKYTEKTSKRFNHKNFNSKIYNSGQVYLVAVFALIVTATVFFVMISPLSEQAKGIIYVMDSNKALRSAETGLEVELLKNLKGIEISDEILNNFNYSSIAVDSEIAIIGKERLVERTLFFGQ